MINKLIKTALLVSAILIISFGATQAADIRDLLTFAGNARITEVVDGDTVVLDDGRWVRLVGIQSPKALLGKETKAALATLVLERVAELRTGGKPRDRHERTLAHLFVDGVWVQGEMLSLGMARVYTLADNRALAAEMYAIEHSARAKNLGLWGHPAYAIRTPTEAGELIGSFQIIAGPVVEATRKEGRIYLNFGADWRNDFTASIPSDAAALFRKAGINPLTWKGRLVQVRGWLESYNGPLISITHPEQIEVQ